MLAWHFLSDDRRVARNARNGRLSPHAGKPVTPGLRLTVPGTPVPERWGLHASVAPSDALFWAPGLVVCRVMLGGQVVAGDRKVAAQERTVLWMADAGQAVSQWGVTCAREWVERERREGRAVRPESERAIRARELWLSDRRRGAEAMTGAMTGARHVEREMSGDRLAALCYHLVSPNATAYRNVAQRVPGYDRTEAGRAEAETLERLLLALEEHVGASALSGV
jgi:hypothetical protein